MGRKQKKGQVLNQDTKKNKKKDAHKIISCLLLRYSIINHNY